MRKYSVDAFMEACEATPPLLLDIRREGEQTGRRVALNQPFALIGRASAADLPLKDPRLGRRHAYLQVVAGQVCFVNLIGPPEDPWGDQTTPSGWLPAARAVRLGAHELRVLRGGGAGTAALAGIDPLTAGTAPRLGMPSLTVEFLRGDAVRLRWRMDRLLALVGSSQECKVRIASREVSAFHCCLVATRQGTWLVDLLGRGGTHLNNVQVRQARLDDGDVLRLGDVSIRVRYDEAALPMLESPASVEGAAAEPAPCGLLLPPPSALPPASFPGRELTSAGPLTFGPGLPLALGDGPRDPTLTSALLPFMSQFAAVQQQMFDQFQHALVQMFEMFSGLHKDQMGFLRQELDHQRQLTRELQELQGELRKFQEPAPAGEGTASPAANGTGGPQARVIGWAAPNREAPVPPGQAGAAAVPAPANAAPPQGAASGGEPGPELKGEDVHAWLYQRMASLQQERQSSWQKIVNFLTGKRPENSLP